MLFGSLEEFEGFTRIRLNLLNAELSRIEKNHVPECPALEKVKDEEQIIFNFEGAGGYSPKKARFYQFLADHNIENYQEFKKICIRMKIDCDEIHQQIARERRGFHRLQPLSLELASGYMKDNHFIYYSQKQRRKAQKCLLSLIEEARAKGKTLPKVKIMGYSWGGNAAVKLVKKLKNKTELPIASVYTIDPVRKSLGILRNVFLSQDLNFFRKYKNVESHYNIYQKEDSRTLSLILGIKGNSVRNSDIDIEVNFEKEIRQDFAHQFVADSPEAIELMDLFMKD